MGEGSAVSALNQSCIGTLDNHVLPEKQFSSIGLRT